MVDEREGRGERGRGEWKGRKEGRSWRNTLRGCESRERGRRESGGGGGLGGIGRVEEALGRGKRRCLRRRGMATADGVSRETTGWRRAPPQGLRGIAAGEEV